MNNTFRIVCASVIGFCALTATSCKKKENSSPVCHISTITTTDQNGTYTDTLAFSGNRIVSRNNGGVTYRYSGKTIDIGFYGTRVKVNNFGMIDSVITDINSSRPLKSKYVYDGSGTLKSLLNGYSSSYDKYYTFEDGDLKYVHTANSIGVYTYNMDKAYEDADPLKIEQTLNYGAYAYTNKHQIKSINYDNGVFVIDYTYEYDAAKRISKVTQKTTGRPDVIEEYKYSCD